MSTTYSTLISVAQLQALIHQRFVIATDHAQLAHFPRYLKAMQIRILRAQ